MRSGNFINRGLCDGLKRALAREEKKASRRLAKRVEAEEKICLTQKDRTVLLQEANALEGRPIYYREHSGVKEQRLDCKRVGKTFLLVSKNGGEPYRITRDSKEIIRTPEERLLGIYDEKVELTEKTLQAEMSSALQKLEGAGENLMKEFELTYRNIENLRKFRGRVYDTLSRRGFLVCRTKG